MKEVFKLTSYFIFTSPDQIHSRKNGLSGADCPECVSVLTASNSSSVVAAQTYIPDSTCMEDEGLWLTGVCFFSFLSSGGDQLHYISICLHECWA